MVGEQKRTIVIGAGGFLGTTVSRYLINTSDMCVIGFDVLPQTGKVGFEAYICTNRIEQDLVKILADFRPDYLLHLAGNANVGKSLVDPRYDFQSGVDLFSIVLDNIRCHSQQTKVIFASSAAIYGQPYKLPITEFDKPDPVSPYGYNKLFCELMAVMYSRVYGLKTASARIFSAYGPGLRKQILWDLSNKCCADELIELSGDGRETRDFIHCDDIADALNCILQNGKFIGETYNIASGEEITISYLAQMVIKEFGADIGRLKFSGIHRFGDPNNWQADISKLKSLGFEPKIKLSDGISDYVRWFKNQ